VNSRDGAPKVLSPEAAFGIQVTKGPKACLYACLSVIDYLLPLNLPHQVENVFLYPYYFDLKWDDYRNKMANMLSCLGDSPLPSLKNEALSRKPANRNLGIEVFDKSLVANSCESTIEEYKKAFPRMDQQVINHRIIPHKFVTRDPASPVTRDCNAREGIVPKRCVIVPGPEGDEWIGQLKESGCTGNVFAIQFGEDSEDFVAVRAQGTEDLLWGYTASKSSGKDFSDEDWIRFHQTTITGEKDSSGAFTVVIRLRDPLKYSHRDIPLDLEVISSGSEMYLWQTQFMKLASVGQGKIGLVQQRAPQINLPKTPLEAIFWPPKDTKYPPFNEELKALRRDALADCIEYKEVGTVIHRQYSL